MIEWFTIVQVIVALRRRPALHRRSAWRAASRPTSRSGAVALVELLLVVQLVVAIVAPLVGNQPTGSLARVLRLPRVGACHPAARRWLLGADRAHPLEHRRPRRRCSRGRRHGLPDAADLVRAGA